ncbi:lipopolysaccharide assembly protein LapB [Pseudomonas sp. FW300-N2F2]|uniref:tetratricopeptide repeat protein n=1 Tax=Pseudomonas sp. FW300-N2F2 TaxID=2751320 RepID=UPI001A923C82|nr:tetratricopeptide repeat protein [Pseudomonas sp. FW300-N2F2]
MSCSRLLLTLGLFALLTLSGCASITGGLTQGQANAPRASKESAEALRLARILRDNGRLEAACGVYGRMDERNELSPTQLLEYATVAANVRSAQQSLALFGRARQQLGGDGQLKPAEKFAISLGLARARLSLGQTDSAAQDFANALRIAPQSTEALNGIGVIASSQGRSDQAQQAFNQVLEIEPSNQAALNNLALVYLDAGQPQKTIDLLQSVEQNSSPTLVLNLSLAYLLQGNETLARQVLDQSLPTIQTTPLFGQLQASAQRIREGQRASSELLNASRRPLALNTLH